MTEIYNIGDDEIRVAGRKRSHKNKSPRWWIYVVAGIAVVAVVAVLLFSRQDKLGSVGSVETVETEAAEVWYNNVDSDKPSCVVVDDVVVDSLNLKVFTPYNVLPVLHVGELDTSDADILFAALAADIRRDNGKIVGAFVYAGEPLSWGLSKRGYCAISDYGIAIGVAENSPLFEQATEDGGSFFRQYPAVDKGKAVENNPENLSYRRALCALDGKVCVVVSTDRVLMDDFSAALVKLGVQDAIFLVGGTADGWCRTEDGTYLRLGRKMIKNNRFNNYIVFRAQ